MDVNVVAPRLLPARLPHVRPSGRCSRAVRIRIRRIIEISVISGFWEGEVANFFPPDRLWSWNVPTDSSCLGWCARHGTPCGMRKLVFLPSIDYKLGRSTSVLFALLFVGPSQITLFVDDSQSPRDGWRRDYAQDEFLAVGSLSRLARLGRAYRKSVDQMSISRGS